MLSPRSFPVRYCVQIYLHECHRGSYFVDMDTPMESTVQAWLAKVSCASSSSDEIKRPRGVHHSTKDAGNAPNQELLLWPHLGSRLALLLIQRSTIWRVKECPACYAFYFPRIANDVRALVTGHDH
jgi:hypothetical protein